MVLEEVGRGTLQRPTRLVSRGDQIETPYLQLVMARLWGQEQSQGSLTLSVGTLDELGGAQAIVRTHLDEALRTLAPEERDLAADLFHHLVTPSGSKIAHAAADLAQYLGRSEAEVSALLEKLARPDTRIVRAVAAAQGEQGPTRYEIFHDVLAPSVLDWRTRQTAARRAEEQRRAARAVARRRVLRVGASVGVIAFMIVAALALVAEAQRNDARHQALRARLLAQRDREEEQRANHLALKAKSEARRASSLAASNRRRAQKESMLASLAGRNAALSRELAAAATAQGLRAGALAATNAQQATHEAVLASVAHRDAGNASEIASFNPTFTARVKPISRDYLKVPSLGLNVPSGTVVTASCTSGGCLSS